MSLVGERWRLTASVMVQGEYRADAPDGAAEIVSASRLVLPRY